MRCFGGIQAENGQRKKLKWCKKSVEKMAEKSPFFRNISKDKSGTFAYNITIKTKRIPQNRVQNIKQRTTRNEGFMMTAVMTLLFLILPCVGMIPARIATRFPVEEETFDYLTF